MHKFKSRNKKMENLMSWCLLLQEWEIPLLHIKRVIILQCRLLDVNNDNLRNYKVMEVGDEANGCIFIILVMPSLLNGYSEDSYVCSKICIVTSRKMKICNNVYILQSVVNVIPTYSNLKHFLQFSRYTEFGGASPHKPLEDMASCLLVCEGWISSKLQHGRMCT